MLREGTLVRLNYPTTTGDLTQRMHGKVIRLQEEYTSDPRGDRHSGWWFAFEGTRYWDSDDKFVEVPDVCNRRTAHV